MTVDAARANADMALWDSSELESYIDRMRSGKVLIVGDVMLDEYLIGDAERISPEAPVPIIKVESDSLLVGGAGNVARNIQALGGSANLVSMRGDDAPGHKLVHALDNDRIKHCFCVHPQRPTTMKTRVLARQQQVLRFDREDDSPYEDKDIDVLLANIRDRLPECGVVVVSDYGKGVVCERLMNGLRAAARTRPEGIPLLVDPKPGNLPLYKQVTLLTPNAKETSESVSMPVRTPEQVIEAGKAIMRRLGCEHLITTLGSRGMAVFENQETVTHIPTTASQVFDVTGAGDTVISVLALALAVKVPLLQACLLANYAAGIVIRQVGAAVSTAEALKEAVITLPRPLMGKWT